MKIRLSKTKRGVVLRFAAQSTQESIDLKDIVLAMAKSTDVNTAIAALGKRGYTGGITKETRSTKEFTLKVPNADPS